VLEVDEFEPSSATNTLKLGAGLNPGDVTVGVANGAFTLTFGTSGDQVILDYMADDRTQGVQQVKFFNGTTWDWDDINELVPINIVTGTVGDDSLSGSSRADLFDGLGGNDQVDGGAGNDIFIFKSGYGHLEISHYDVTPGVHSVLQFGVGIAPGDVTKSVNAEGDVVLDIGSSGDQVVLKYQDWQSATDGDGIQAVEFDNGTIWSSEDLYVPQLTGTIGNDNLFDTAGADTLDGMGAPGWGDYIQGHGGGDTIVFNSGYGILSISEVDNATTPLNTLAFGTGITSADVSVNADQYGSIVLSIGSGGDVVNLYNMLSDPASGVQQVTFADSTVWNRADILALLPGYITVNGSAGDDYLYGTAGVDHIDGKGGTDVLTGNGGNDIYAVNNEGTNVTINNTASGSSSHGTLQFSSDFSEETLWFKQAGNDLVVQEIGHSTQVTVTNWFGSDTTAKLSEIAIDGGSEIDSQLNSLISAMATFANDNPAFDPTSASSMPSDTSLQTAIAAAWH
jgi:Ca2+-binding RTX toxin-like protein